MSFEKFDLIYNNKNDPLHLIFLKSLQVISDMIRIFGLNSIAISFNGGKDATICFYLLFYIIRQLKQKEESNSPSNTSNSSNNSDSSNTPDTSNNSNENLLGHLIPIIYFHDPRSFPEMTQFLEEIKLRYNLNYEVYNCSYKEGMKDMTERKGIKAIVMGVRKGDPYTETAEYFTPSSPDWPSFMRVYPLLNWKYSEVWSFIRTCQIPYCVLYDCGYTSIGLTHNTKKHESLKVTHNSNNSDNNNNNNENNNNDNSSTNTTKNIDYLPAYQLSDNYDERESRVETSKTKINNNHNNNNDSETTTLISYSSIIIIYDLKIMKNRLAHMLSSQFFDSIQQLNVPIIILNSLTISTELPKYLENGNNNNNNKDILIYGEFLPTEYETKSSEILSMIENNQHQTNNNCNENNLSFVEGKKENIRYFLIKYEEETIQLYEEKLKQYYSS